jgi:hypothetical protein
MTTIKITELSDIGANLTTSTLVPVVNMAGVPVTQKTNVGNIANLILEGAGVDYPEASVALLAQTVSNAAQPNITSVGTLTNIVVSGNASINGNITSNGTAYLGNISTTGEASITTLVVGSSSDLGSVTNVIIEGGTDGQVLTTDGDGNLSWTTVSSGNSSYGDSNVVSLMAAFGSNTITTTGNVSVGNIIGNGQALTNIAGANVSGFVPNANVANTAFAVAAANVSGLGNIATTNYDGNASNVLHGDGTWSADTTTYGNSNVVTLLSAFGSNTITTTGNISGGNLVTGGEVVANGNVSSGTGLSTGGFLSVDGNADLHDTSVTGNLAATGNITAINLGNISSINLDGNVSNLLTGNGTYVAIPVVPTVGNIATINLTGSNSNVLYGNGVFAAVTVGNLSQISNGNSNVTLTDTNGNVYINTNGGTQKQWIFDTVGNLRTPGNVDIYGAINFPQEVSSLNWSTYNIELSQYGRINTNVDFFANANTIGALYLKGDGSNISNIAVANVIGLGNIATANLDGSNSNVLYGNGVFAAVAGGGNGTPGGSNTQIQFNDSGNFGANSGFTFDSTTGNIGIPGIIIGSNTIEFDNRATGNSADINLYSADDILIQARDRDAGSTAEGGDINIFAGDSAEDSDTSAGDIVIEAGRGGASNLDSGGDGGFIRIEAGRGGNAVGANFAARPGGSLTLNAGNAGTNNGNIDLGNTGGDVTINAGDSTGNGDPGGDIILRSGDAGANALAGQIQLIISSSDNGDGGTWTFNGAGIIQLPNNGTIGNEGNNIDIGSTSAISLEASSAVNIYTDTGTNAWQWQFQDDGNLRLPTIELDVGNTINEQTVIQSQRKIIPGLRYSAEINGTTPTVVYTATSVDTTSMKVTMQIQHSGLGFEFFDVSATSTDGNTFYTVSNRVQPPTIDNSTVVVDLNGSNTMDITVTINSGAANSWVTYDATEFGISVD